MCNQKMADLIKRILSSSVKNLFENQPTIFEFTSETGKTEWNLSHHLAFEIQKYLFWLDHDVELIKKNCENKRPDIVFHKRGINELNFLVVEVKTSSEISEDIDKIKENFIDGELYKFGVAIKINVDKSFNACLITKDKKQNFTSEESPHIKCKQNDAIIPKIKKQIDQIFSIVKSNDYLDNPEKQSKVNRLEKEIDQLVYKLYELTPEMNINNTLSEFFSETPIVFCRDDNNANKKVKTKIITFLKESNFDSKFQQAITLTKELVKPHNKDPLYQHIVELYKVEKATRSLTKKRDHVIHALNTFLLGIYINSKYLGNKVDMFQWKLTALFHDIAYPLYISQMIIEKYFETVEGIKNNLGIASSNPTMNIVPNNFEKLTNNKTAFDYIQNRIDKWGLKVDVEKKYSEMSSSNIICHGMISALTVLYLIDLMYQKNNSERKYNDSNWSQEYFETDVVSACSAIFLHNLRDDAFENIDKTKASLAYLLKLSDELQNWDRMQEGDSPENYDVDICNDKLYFKTKSEDSKNRISKKIACLNDESVKIEGV